MNGRTGAQRKRELARFKKTASGLARKAESVKRARAKLEKSLQQWARKHRIPSKSYRAKAPSRTTKPCKPIIDHPTGPWVCVLISSSPGKCVYRCYRI